MTRVLLLLVTVVLAGCGPQIRLADPASTAQARQFAPAAGNAGLYVYFMGGFNKNRKQHLTIDGQDVGDTVEQTFLFVELPPGQHVVRSQGKADPLRGASGNVAELPLYVRPGEVAYLEQTISGAGWMGPFYITRLVRRSADQARPQILKCRASVAKAPVPQ